MDTQTVRPAYGFAPQPIPFPELHTFSREELRTEIASRLGLPDLTGITLPGGQDTYDTLSHEGLRELLMFLRLAEDRHGLSLQATGGEQRARLHHHRRALSTVPTAPLQGPAVLRALSEYDRTSDGYHLGFGLNPEFTQEALPNPGDAVDAWTLERLSRLILPGDGYFDLRRSACQRLAWAVPNEAALDAIEQAWRNLQARVPEAGITELGCGSGFWAHLLRSRGLTISAYDDHSWEAMARTRWTTVTQGGPEVLSKHRQDLLLIWPPNSDMPGRALDHWQGQELMLITEPSDSTCPAFLGRLDREFTLSSVTALPSWPGVYDQLEPWVRR